MKYINFNHVAEGYDTTRFVPQTIVENFGNLIFSHLETEFDEPPYRILSLGIGSGRVESFLSSEKNHLFGIDISELMLREYKKKTSEHQGFLSLADGCSLPLRPFFHIVTAIHIVHLISRTQKLVEELEKIAKTIVIGDIYTDTYSHPLYQEYSTEIAKSEWKRESSGISIEEFTNIFKEKGYGIMQKEMSAPAEISNLAIYDSLRSRSFSSLWSIPDDYHERALKHLEKYIESTGMKLESNFSTTSFLSLYFIDSRK